MLYRLFSVSGRVRTGLFVLALAGVLMMSACSGDAVQDTVTGTVSTVLGFIIVCAAFHVCTF
jgi:hypothetical protein